MTLIKTLNKYNNINVLFLIYQMTKEYDGDDYYLPQIQIKNDLLFYNYACY